MRFLTLFFSILIASTSTFAQFNSSEREIIWGKEFKESRRSTLGDIVGHDKTGFYVTKIHSGGLYGINSSVSLQHFDNNMNTTKSLRLDLSYQGKKRDFEFIIQLKSGMYLFTSIPDQKTKKKILFRQSINTKTLLPNQKDLTKIAEINYAGNSKRNSGSFDYEISRDDSKVLIFYNLPFDRGQPERFGFHVLDEQLTEIWSRSVTLPYKEELFDVDGFEVDNQGSVYLLGVIYEGKRKAQRRGDPNYKYQVLSYRNEGKDLEEYPIKFKDKFLTDMKIEITNDRDIICAGFYSNEGTTSIIGSYFMRIDPSTKTVKKQGSKEFGIDFIAQNVTEREENRIKRKAKKGKNVELYEYDLDRIILRGDGGAILIGEQYYIKKINTSYTDATGRFRSRSITYYYYNDIIAVNISPEGEIEWAEKIQKKQTTSSDGGFYSSYAMAVVKNKLYFVFNDNPRNIERNSSGRVYNFSGGRESLVVLVTVNARGEQKREPLFSTAEAEVIIRPKVSSQVAQRKMILFGQKRKNQRFAQLIFK